MPGKNTALVARMVEIADRDDTTGLAADALREGSEVITNLSARLERAEGALKVAQLALPVLRTMLNKAGFHVGAERALETFNAVNKALEPSHDQ